MASKSERTIINAAGLVQGIVLVTFPAACTIFTDKSQYGLSSTRLTFEKMHTYANHLGLYWQWLL
jgi:hypothetical protein